MKICIVGVELFHADGRTDGQTDMTMLIFVCRNFQTDIKSEILPFVPFVIFKFYTATLKEIRFIIISRDS